MLSVSTQLAQEDDLATFERMLKSVSFANELIIYSMERRDQAAAMLYKKYKARVIEVKTPKIVEEIRRRQIQEAKGDWVLVMDYDEVITLKLAKEIKINIKNPQSNTAAYAIPRRNFSLGYPLRYGGWGGDYEIRLINKSDFSDWPTNIHSFPVLAGPVAKLKELMEHHKDASIAQMVEKTNRYSDVEAQLFLNGGLAPVTVLTLIRKPVMEFVRRYFLKLGFLDGKIGLLQSLYQSYSVFITYSKLYEKQHDKH